MQHVLEMYSLLQARRLQEWFASLSSSFGWVFLVAISRVSIYPEEDDVIPILFGHVLLAAAKSSCRNLMPYPMSAVRERREEELVLVEVS